MKKQINKKLPAFTAIIIISILIFNGSCSKDTKSQDSGQTITGGSKIIYTDINPDSVITAAPNSISHYELDLNNDGTSDFDIYAGSMNGRCAPDVTIHQPNVTYVKVQGLNGNSFGDTTLAPGAAIFPVPLDFGREIGKDTITWSGTDFTGFLNLYNSCSTGYAFWLLNIEKYMALRLVVGSSVYFGWVRIGNIQLTFTAEIPALHFTIKDYAYNSVPNQPILAGQTH